MHHALQAEQVQAGSRNNPNKGPGTSYGNKTLRAGTGKGRNPNTIKLNREYINNSKFPKVPRQELLLRDLDAMISDIDAKLMAGEFVDPYDRARQSDNIVLYNRKLEEYRNYIERKRVIAQRQEEGLKSV